MDINNHCGHWDSNFIDAFDKETGYDIQQLCVNADNYHVVGFILIVMEAWPCYGPYHRC